MNDGLSMLGACEIVSRNTEDGISSFVEPDDNIDLYMDFLEKINPYDWINDEYLFELIDNVFNRKEE